MTFYNRDILLVIVTALLIRCAPGQNPQVHPRNQTTPTVTFTLVDWKANPRRYSIAINSAGNTTYQSIPNSVEQTGAPYLAEFLATAPLRQKIFDLAQRLSFLDKPLPGAVRNTASQSSLKTLTYQYGDTHRSFSYQKEKSPAIRQLTTLFEEISATLELGRRLMYLQRHDTEAVGPEVERISYLAAGGRLLEVQAIAPMFRDISLDETIAPKVREQAKALFARYGSTGNR